VRRSESLIHDEAWKTTRRVLAIVAPALREEQLADAAQEIFEEIRSGMRDYHGKVIWLVTRIGSNN
jgi:hypothetical protein